MYVQYALCLDFGGTYLLALYDSVKLPANKNTFLGGISKNFNKIMQKFKRLHKDIFKTLTTIDQHFINPWPLQMWPNFTIVDEHICQESIYSTTYFVFD